MCGKVAEAFPINPESHWKPSCGDAGGKELGHTVTVTAIASAQIAAIMRNQTLDATEKQQGTRALLATQKTSLSVMSSEDLSIVQPTLSDAHAAWLLCNPLLAVDRCGLAMWPRFKKLNSSKLELLPLPLAGKLAPSPWTSDSDSENSSDTNDCASQYPKGAASLFFDRSSSLESAFKASTRASSVSSDTWTTSMSQQKTQATSQDMMSALNHNAKSFGQDAMGMALLQQVVRLEAEKEALQMQIEILRADSKAQDAKNKAELAQVKAQAISEIEQVRANAQADSETDSRVLMKIVKKLKIDSDAQKVKNKSEMEQVKAEAAAASEKDLSVLIRIIKKLKIDSKVLEAKNKAKLAQVKAQASVEIEEVKDNAAAESEKFLKVSSHEDLIQIVRKLQKDSDTQHASAINLGLRWESLEKEADDYFWNPCFSDVTKHLQTKGLGKVIHRGSMNKCADSKSLRNTLQRLEWREFTASMLERIKLNAQGGCCACLPNAAAVVDRWIFTQP